jgi:hypothetical protein
LKKYLGEITLLDLRKTLALAKTARSWVEAYQKKNERYFNNSLVGMCGRASGALHTLLQAHAIPAKICSNYYHAFVVVNNRILLDITATQFNKKHPKIVLRKLKKDEVYYWKQFYSHKDAMSFRVFQQKDGWIDRQVVQPSDLDLQV